MWTRLVSLSVLSFLSSALKKGVQPRPEAFVEKLGHKVFYDPTAHPGYVWWWRENFATYEPATYNIFNRFMNNDTIVLDVGAWIGLTALWEGYAAKEVFALEPTRTAFKELERHLHANPAIVSRVKIINAALGAADDVKLVTDNGNAMDKIQDAAAAKPGSIPVKMVSIESLCEEYPELRRTGFVKIDTEGYERVIVPALEAFLRETRPVAFVSLHEFYVGHDAIQSTVDKLSEIFPYLYEADMKTPFDAARESYDDGDHGGVDVLCTWEKL